VNDLEQTLLDHSEQRAQEDVDRSLLAAGVPIIKLEQRVDEQGRPIAPRVGDAGLVGVEGRDPRFIQQEFQRAQQEGRVPGEAAPTLDISSMKEALKATLRKFGITQPLGEKGILERLVGSPASATEVGRNAARSLDLALQVIFAPVVGAGSAAEDFVKIVGAAGAELAHLVGMDTERGMIDSPLSQFARSFGENLAGMGLPPGAMVGPAAQKADAAVRGAVTSGNEFMRSESAANARAMNRFNEERLAAGMGVGQPVVAGAAPGAQAVIAMDQQISDAARSAWSRLVKEHKADVVGAGALGAAALSPDEQQQELVAMGGGTVIGLGRVKIRGAVAAKLAKNSQTWNDLASVGAAIMHQGETGAAWRRGMVYEFGDAIKPHLDDLERASRVEYSSLMKRTLDAEGLASLEQLLKLARAGSFGKDWYEKVTAAATRWFGPERGKIFLRFVAAHSPNTEVQSNVTRALKTYEKWATGELTPATIASHFDPQDLHKKDVLNVLEGKPLSGPKVRPFDAALAGDHSAIVSDIWMMRAFRFAGDSPKPGQRLFMEKVIADQAAKLGISNRQMQAALWVGTKLLEEGKEALTAPIHEIVRQKLLAKQTAFTRSGIFPDARTLLELDEAGRVNLYALTIVARAAIAAATGAVTGDTWDERIMHALAIFGVSITPDLAIRLGKVLAREVPELQQLAQSAPSNAQRTMKAVPATVEELRDVAGSTRAQVENGKFPTVPQRLIGGEDLVIGAQKIRMDFSAFGDAGYVDTLLNTVANTLEAELKAAKAWDGKAVMSDDALARFAREHLRDHNVAEFLARAKGEIWNAPKQMAAAMTAGRLGDRFEALSARYLALADGVPGKAELEQEMLGLLTAINGLVPQMMGSTSEAARTLRVAGLPVPGLTTAQGLAARATDAGIDTMSAVQGSGATINGLTMKQYSEIVQSLGSGSTSRVLTFTKALPGAGVELVMNGLLSGPQTWATQIPSELFSTFTGWAERKLAERAYTSRGGTAADHIVPGEADWHAKGLWDVAYHSFANYGRSLTDAKFRTATRAVLGGAAGAGVDTASDQLAGRETSYGKLAANVALGAAAGAAANPKQLLTPDRELTRRAVSAHAFGLDEAGMAGKFLDTIGAVIRVPTRSLDAFDQWIRAMNENAEIFAQAHRSATLKGLTGKEYEQEVARRIANPSAEVRQAAKDYGALIAFQSNISGMASGAKQANALVRLAVVPFVTAPANLLKWGTDRAPVYGQLADVFRGEFAAGGARAQYAQARMATGAVMASVAAGLAVSGVLVGGFPGHNDAKKISQAADCLPNTVCIPTGDGKNISFSFTRWDPFGLYLGVAADINQMLPYLDEVSAHTVAGMFVTALSDQVFSRSYVQNLGEFTNAIEEARKKNYEPLRKFMVQLSGEGVPVAAATLERGISPAMSEVRDYVDQLKARTPIWSKTVEPKLNFFADPAYVPHTGLETFDILNPFYGARSAPDEQKRRIAQEVRALQADLQPPHDVIDGSKAQMFNMEPDLRVPGVRLEPAVYTEYLVLFAKKVEVRDQTLVPALYALITQNETYAKLERAGKVQMLKALVAGFRAKAEKELLEAHPELKPLILDVERRRGALIKKPEHSETVVPDALLQTLGAR